MMAEAFGFELSTGVRDGPGEHVRKVAFDREHHRPQARSRRHVTDAGRCRNVELACLRQAEAALHFPDCGDFVVAVDTIVLRCVRTVFALEPGLPVLDLRTTRPGLVWE